MPAHITKIIESDDLTTVETLGGLNYFIGEARLKSQIIEDGIPKRRLNKVLWGSNHRFPKVQDAISTVLTKYGLDVDWNSIWKNRY
jgi:hypothetical protein